MHPIDLIKKKADELQIPEREKGLLLRYLERWYELVTEQGTDQKLVLEVLNHYSNQVFKQFENPKIFESYHSRIKEPVDFTRLGKLFIRFTMDLERSKVFGKERLEEIRAYLGKGENVIFFANHQIEPDPQVIQVLFGDLSGKWADEIIFVAGDRVTKDPLAVPVSLGCNLLSIYSKKYIDIPPELKEHKLLHNKKTLKKMEALLKEGGQSIYVAPSGGRDRKAPDGSLKPAPFDPNSIELFLLISAVAKTKTHFYPLALQTYDLLPPPKTTQFELGEERIPAFSPAYLSVGEEISLEKLQVDSKEMSKEEKRSRRSKLIYDAVLIEYEKLHM